MCYAHICLPNNYCIDVEIDASEFPELLRQGVEDFKKVLRLAIKNVNQDADCPCKHALDHAILSKQK